MYVQFCNFKARLSKKYAKCVLVGNPAYFREEKLWINLVEQV